MEQIRVVVVDDSPFVCRLLARHLNSAENIEVVGIAHNGKQAIALINELKPDVITLDQEMPGISGVESLTSIMHDCPVPVVMITGVSKRSAALTRQALDIGAVDFVLKYAPGVDCSPAALRHEIISKVRAAAKIRVIRSIRTLDGRDAAPQHTYSHHIAQAVVSEATAHDDVPSTPVVESDRHSDTLVQGGVVVIGASTGGPVALRELLSQLDADFPSAILVVQHMPATFTEVLAQQINRHTALAVREASHGDRLVAGEVLVAPGDQHMLIGSDSRIILNRGPKIRGHRPSIDVTMQSVTQVYGAKTSGVVLTGMGDDGSEGIVAIRAKGGCTFAQDAESCVVNGMPQRARDRGVVDYVATPAELATYLVKTRKTKKSKAQIALPEMG